MDAIGDWWEGSALLGHAFLGSSYQRLLQGLPCGEGGGAAARLQLGLPCLSGNLMRLIGMSPVPVYTPTPLCGGVMPSWGGV